mgnify:CR=1 FL=1
MPTLSEALHARLDEMGAPRDQAEPPEVDEDELEEALPEDPDDSPLETEDDQDEAEAAESSDTADAEPPAAGKYKVAELAQAIGWTPADLYTDLIVPLGNGESRTLGELKNERDTWVKQQAEIHEAREFIRAQAEQLRQQQQQFFASAQSVSSEIDDARGEMRAIEAQYSNVDWDTLDRTDPGRAANVRQKFATAYAQAQTKLQQAEGEYHQTVAQSRQQMVQAEDQRTLQLIPEWRDAAVVQEELPQITQYLLSRGFTRSQLDTVFDAAARAVARDAWMYARQQQATKQAVDRVRKAPKRVLRGGKSNGTGTNERKLQALEQRALSTGHPNDKLNAARAILQSSLRR